MKKFNLRPDIPDDKELQPIGMDENKIPLLINKKRSPIFFRKKTFYF
jgi:hypothetical protein